MIHALVLGAVMTTMLGIALARPFVGLLAFDLISFMNPQQEAWGIGSQIPWALLAAIATVIGCVVAREPRKLPVNAFTILIVIFLILISISTVFALGPADLVNKHYFLVMKSFGFMILACGLLTTRKRIHALIWLMVLSVGYYGVKGGVFTILTGGHDHVVGVGRVGQGESRKILLSARQGGRERQGVGLEGRRTRRRAGHRALRGDGPSPRRREGSGQRPVQTGHHLERRPPGAGGGGPGGGAPGQEAT